MFENDIVQNQSEILRPYKIDMLFAFQIDKTNYNR